MLDEPVVITCTGCLNYSEVKDKCRLGYRRLAAACVDWEYKEPKYTDNSENRQGFLFIGDLYEKKKSHTGRR